jgi:hypothetical protein
MQRPPDPAESTGELNKVTMRALLKWLLEEYKCDVLNGVVVLCLEHCK